MAIDDGASVCRRNGSSTLNRQTPPLSSSPAVRTSESMVDIYEWTNHTEAFPFSTFDSQCVQVVRHYLANNISLLEEDLREEPCWNSTFDLACLFENVGNATYLREDFKSCRNSTEDDFNPFYFYQVTSIKTNRRVFFACLQAVPFPQTGPNI